MKLKFNLNQTTMLQSVTINSDKQISTLFVNNLFLRIESR